MKSETNTEQRLEEIARDLGDQAASRFDPNAAAEKVVARLRVEGREKKNRFKATRILMRVAAVAVIAIGLGVVAQNAGDGVDPISAPVELADFTDDELTEVMDSLFLEEPVYELASGDLYDLNEAELAELLELMEG